MRNKKSILLSDFEPVSQLVLPVHEIKRPRFPAIDIHTHFGRLVLGENYESLYDVETVVEKMQNYGIAFAVNLDAESGIYTDRMLGKLKGYENFFINFGTVDVTKVDQIDFEHYVYSTIQELVMKGIKGLKFWKTFGLSLQDSKGEKLKIDDKRFNCIWQTAAQFNLPILIHIADPVAFFNPIDRHNERIEELWAHPEWSFYGDKYCTFDELMEMQQNLLANNPETTFIVAHCGSYSENLAVVSDWLDKYPNMMVDFADRIAELGRQPYTARAFLNKYQDRVLFGSDTAPTDIEKYPIIYRFLETYDEYFDYSASAIPPQGRWKIFGVGLDDAVLEKIYYSNASKLLKI